MTIELTAEQRAHEKLLELLEGVETIYTILVNRRVDGMSWVIKPIIAFENRIIDLSYWVKELGLYKIHRQTGGLIITGGNMDMGFHLVYSITRTLYGDDYRRISHEWI